ncbi:Oidioi.mRNA.OKI2018_I69.chr2.g4102.t1.cds [Oikopleura dioica]|uniref:Oidioi.mRNA.OKI2018_I69.chr2.g4102.t1.cds n=1 Tax=Oikopleura dioica TaxID=34765 RepID=A0ABN7T042_OIKDI|nr:Oidioi.mRNA.OKI2018_I69.chr2.g4102.t1.cds [Oikopleura dioica]
MKISQILINGILAAPSSELLKSVPGLAELMDFQENLERSARSDGNAFLIRQMLEFYLSQAGFDTSLAEQMLNYGCYCNLLPNRFQGKGDPVDNLDLFCQQYQRCSKCNVFDNIGVSTDNGNICSVENALYEISFNAEIQRLDCSSTASQDFCGANQCKCDEELAFQLAAHAEFFVQEHAVAEGFDFADQCMPSGNTGGSLTGPGNGSTNTPPTAPGPMQCCGEYPRRSPFHPFGGAKACCEASGTQYDTLNQKCCPSGVKNINAQC